MIVFQQATKSITFYKPNVKILQSYLKRIWIVITPEHTNSLLFTINSSGLVLNGPDGDVTRMFVWQL